MQTNQKAISSLVDYIKVDQFYISCHFKCDVKNKTIVSTVPFEPYNGKVCLTWKDVVFHPIASYNLYFHTPVTIFNAECHETIVLKAFQEVSNYFTWNQKENRYIYN